MKIFKGRAIFGGDWSGEAIVSRQGFNTLSSMKKSILLRSKEITVSDQNNTDLYGKKITGKALCLPTTIGSTSGGMVLQTAIDMKMAPAVLLFSKRIDSLAAAGVITAQIWNNRHGEIYVIDELGEVFIQTVKSRDQLDITKSGEVVIHSRKS